MTDAKPNPRATPEEAKNLGVDFLKESDPCLSELIRVFAALGVNSKFEYRLNLIESLQKSVERYSLFDSHNSAVAKTLASSLSDAARIGRDADLKLRQINARTGAKKRYPLAVPFIYPVEEFPDNRENALHIFRALFLFDLLDPGPSISQSWREGIATQLELATKESGARRNFVYTIRFKYSDDLDNRLEALKEALEKKLKSDQGNRSEEALLVQALVVVLGSRVRLRIARAPRSQTVATPWKRTPTQSRKVTPNSNPGGYPDFPRAITTGTIEIFYIDPAPDDATDEFPEPNYSFLPKVDVAAGPGELQPPLEDLKYEAKRSGRWVTNLLNCIQN